MSKIFRMSSILTSPGTLRNMCTELGELVVQGNTFLCLCIRVFQASILHVIYISIYRRSGVSVTLVTREDWKTAGELIHILERAGQVG